MTMDHVHSEDERDAGAALEGDVLVLAQQLRVGAAIHATQ